MFSYRCYGLNLVSDTLILPLNMDARVASEAADLTVFWTTPDFHQCDWQLLEARSFRQRKRIIVQCADTQHGERCYHLKYDISNFGKVSTWLNLDRKQLWLEFPLSMNQRDCGSMLIGTILGSIIRLMGHLSLHASVVSDGSNALAMVARGGVGKSTMAASLLQCNESFSLIADDVAVVDLTKSHPRAQPGYPALRLHEDAFNSLNISDKSLSERVYSDAQKRYIPMASMKPNQTAQEPWPREPVVLGGICLLAASHDPSSPCQLTRISKPSAILNLTINTYANYVILEDDRLGKEFKQISDLVENVPVYQLSYHKSMQTLAKVNSIITALMKGLKFNDVR